MPTETAEPTPVQELDAEESSVPVSESPLTAPEESVGTKMGPHRITAVLWLLSLGVLMVAFLGVVVGAWSPQWLQPAMSLCSVMIGVGYLDRGLEQRRRGVHIDDLDGAIQDVYRSPHGSVPMAHVKRWWGKMIMGSGLVLLGLGFLFA